MCGCYASVGRAGGVGVARAGAQDAAASPRGLAPRSPGREGHAEGSLAGGLDFVGVVVLLGLGLALLIIVLVLLLVIIFVLLVVLALARVVFSRQGCDPRPSSFSIPSASSSPRSLVSSFVRVLRVL